jgi:hypothetical protein
MTEDEQKAWDRRLLLVFIAPAAAFLVTNWWADYGDTGMSIAEHLLGTVCLLVMVMVFYAILCWPLAKGLATLVKALGNRGLEVRALGWALGGLLSGGMTCFILFPVQSWSSVSAWWTWLEGHLVR